MFTIKIMENKRFDTGHCLTTCATIVEICIVGGAVLSSIDDIGVISIIGLE